MFIENISLTPKGVIRVMTKQTMTNSSKMKGLRLSSWRRSRIKLAAGSHLDGTQVLSMGNVGTLGLDVDVKNDTGEIILLVGVEEVDELLLHLTELAFTEGALLGGGLVAGGDGWRIKGRLGGFAVGVQILSEHRLLFLKAFVLGFSDDLDCIGWALLSFWSAP